MIDVDRFGTRLRMLRSAAFMSQRELSERSGVPQPNISRIEAGEQDPQEDTMRRLLAPFAGRVAAESIEGAAALMQKPGAAHVERERAHGTLEDVDLSIDYADPDFLIGTMVARGAVTMLAGEHGAGKSMFCQSVSVAMATGRGEMAGVAVEPGHVAYFDAENGKELLVPRLRRMGLLEGAWAHAHPTVAHGGFNFEQQREMFEEKISQRPCDLLVMDSWQSLWTGGHWGWDNALVSCLNLLRDIARRRQLGVLLIHHATKAHDTYKGSSVIGATIEGVFTLTRAANGMRKVACVKQRLAAEPAPLYLHVGADGTTAASDEERREYEEDGR